MDVRSTPIRVVVVTLDAHLAGGFERAGRSLARRLPGLTVGFHVAADWDNDPASLERCRADIDRADILVAHMLFMDEHIRAVLPWLARRAPVCDAFVGCMSAREVAELTRLGRFRIDGEESGLLGLLKSFRRRKSDPSKPSTAGSRQAAMLRHIPNLLRFLPGAAQDLRAYLLTMQYWLAGSEENVEHMIAFLIDRYAAGPRAALRGTVEHALPIRYPAEGLYHPALANRITEEPRDLPRRRGDAEQPTVGLLLMRSYVLARNTAHYDGVIQALDERGLRVVPAFASGLDARPAIERYFVRDGRATVDAVVSLTGFSLVGGPAYSDPKAAEEMLARLDVPYVCAQATEFQSLEQWEASEGGLLPIEATMMVAIPELDGATGPIVFGGQAAATGARAAHAMRAHPERARMLARRVERLVSLRRKRRADRRVGIVLFNFPPNSGHVGTAMSLAVFESLHATLGALRDAGYGVEVPDTVDALRARILGSSADPHGVPAAVHARIPVDRHVREERHLAEIEAAWGPAPGRQLTDGRSIFVLGARFGNVLVGVQPGSGYEGDPMRLLFERGMAPTHAFSAFYRHLREDFAADVLLHFGTHGALEFMPGKQIGLSQACWPDRLIGDVPNVYLYAANNPSEAVLAKRRSGATLVSHLTPPISEAGQQRAFSELKTSIERHRALTPARAADPEEGGLLVELIRSQAAALDLAFDAPGQAGAGRDAGAGLDVANAAAAVEALRARIAEVERALVPIGLHVVGSPPGRDDRIDLLGAAMKIAGLGDAPEALARSVVDGDVSSGRRHSARGASADVSREQLATFVEADRLLARDTELPALIAALDARYIRPAPGGDLIRNLEILPTGRNIHGFDPFRMPTSFALAVGRRLADQLLARHRAENAEAIESVALVLWGSDNLKTEGASIAQALALMGARPRLDGYGRLAGAELVPLDELAHSRIDVVVTLSGIFRDLFPLQTRMLAEAAQLAALADEPVERNFVRKHAQAYVAAHGGTLEDASLRVFGNAVGAYGAHVSQLVQEDAWQDGDELADVFTRRKSFAYGPRGETSARPELFERVLARVDLAYQNLDSVELGVTSIDVYFDNLGGMSRAIGRASGRNVPVYVGDSTQGESRVRTLSEQVALETRSRVLNPKWYEGMLRHGYEGVQELESHVTNTLGWSATTGQVDSWVYGRIAETFVLDDAMRQRLADLNLAASSRMANRLLEAHARHYWTPDPETLSALQAAGDELEDRIEGIGSGVAAA
ncbi:MAG: magnesium chelatase subunit H [Myxococcota bacterium]